MSAVYLPETIRQLVCSEIFKYLKLKNKNFVKMDLSETHPHLTGANLCALANTVTYILKPLSLADPHWRRVSGSFSDAAPTVPCD